MVALLGAHLRQMHEVTPAEGVFALDVDALAAPDISFWSVRDDGALLAVGALKDLGDGHLEVKSMHTAAAVRGRGVARALLHHLLAEARARGASRVSLETGVQDAFVPARALYASAGFEVCEAFGPYVGSTTSVCMTLDLRSVG